MQLSRLQLFPGVAAELVPTLHKAHVPFAVVPEHRDNPMVRHLLNAFIATCLTTIITILAAAHFGVLEPLLAMFGVHRRSPLAFFVDIAEDGDIDVSFEDVAGCDGAKLELTEVVDFLHSPEKYATLGAQVPKGVIMEGPPGTGKTLLARAAAGEAGVPFISASGSEFVEMYAGVGASRVRALFEEAREKAPCIVFIDEIDAVGGARSSADRGGSGGTDEREQTLNQILIEMDGFEGSSGVLVLAATNRADVLDAALLRPGRFDRRVNVGLPDAAGREEILKVHARDKRMSRAVDLAAIARRTVGYSGAELATVLNEAAIGAARDSRSSITASYVEAALDRVMLGLSRPLTRTASVRRLLATHEAGHALLGFLLEEYETPARVSIVQRAGAPSGITVFVPDAERVESGLYSYKYLAAQLTVSLGGRAAEALLLGEDDVSTASADDLQRVRSLARRMVAQWGFVDDRSPLSGAPVAWESSEGSGLVRPKCASKATEALIDAEVARQVDDAYDRAVSILRAHREALDATVEALVERETLRGMDLAKLVNGTGGATHIHEVLRRRGPKLRFALHRAKRGAHAHAAVLVRTPRTRAEAQDATESPSSFDA